MKPGTYIQVNRTGEHGTVVSSQQIPYVGTIVHVEMDNGTDRDFNRFELIEIDSTDEDSEGAYLSSQMQRGSI